MFIKSILKVSFFTFISRILGLIRDTTTAVFLGASAYSDAFIIAFKLPNVFRRLFAEGSLNSVFIPIFSNLINTEKEEARKFSNEIFTILFISLFIIIGIMEIIMPSVLVLFAPGFKTYHKEEYDLAVTLTRITMPYLLFISLASVYASILNGFKKFSMVALMPSILNSSIIGCFLFSSIYNFGLDNSYFGCLGIILGGLCQFITMFLCAYRLNWKLVFVKLNKMSEATKSFFKRVLPVVITAGIYQINIFIDLTIASWLGGGSITYLYYGDRLNQLPLAIIGIAISTVIIPFIVGNKSKHQDTSKLKANAILYAIVLSLPAVFAFLVLGKEIVTVLFQYGKFNATSASYTYYVLCCYSLGLIPNILIKIIVAIFYAESDGKTPFYVNVGILIFNTLLAIALAIYFGVIGIALATSISSSLSVIILGTLLSKKKLITIGKAFVKETLVAFAATCFIFGILFLIKDSIINFFKLYFGYTGFIISFFLLMIFTAMFWIITLKLVKSESYSNMTSLLKKKVSK